MKHTRVIAAATALVLLLSACQNGNVQMEKSQIYLYGETHGVERMLEKELELWQGYYEDNDMRHLFIELPYYTAEFLNLWMQEDDDKILDEIYADWAGTQSQTPQVKAFYQEIKEKCPETIFHGTDVGHTYATTGQRYLNYLKENNLEKSEQYQLAQECKDQGVIYYSNQSAVYRENKMVENFIREFDKLDGDSIMGIYGAAHVGIDEMDFTNEVPSMANQLGKVYGDALHSEKLEKRALKEDTIEVNGKEYTATNYGTVNLAHMKIEYVSSEFWRLEDAYDDFKDNARTVDILPYNDYPMKVEAGQVFVIDYTKADGTVDRMYLRSDEGALHENLPTTVGFTVD